MQAWSNALQGRVCTSQGRSPAFVASAHALPTSSINARVNSHQSAGCSATPLCSTPLAYRSIHGQRQDRTSLPISAATPAGQMSSSPGHCSMDVTNAEPSYICTSVTAATVDAFLAEIQEAASSGVDIIELRLDFITDFNVERDLDRIMKSCPLPYIITYRPVWEGGNYDGPEPERLATLKFAALNGAPYVDIEFKAIQYFFADRHEVPLSTRIITSYHDFKQTPEAATLHQLVDAMWKSGADIVKVAAMANNITDSAVMLSLLQQKKGPTISLAMGERGGLVRLLAAKYGGYLTFAAMSPERASAPGQPDIQKLRGLYNYSRQRPDTKLFGIIGNPVSHSRSPLIHNTAFQHIGFDGVYVPLLVDNLAQFLEAFKDHDFYGFSVTVPHKEDALKAAKEVDPVAQQIGAVNTLIRQPDGSFKGYNTDWQAAIGAIERSLVGGALVAGAPSPLKGKTVVVLGAGGAGRALAFGAASRGAKVVITNRTLERAQQLAKEMNSSPLAGSMSAPVEAVAWEDVTSGKVAGNVLANTTSVGMASTVGQSPVPADVVGKYECVFDAIYTPVWTQLLLDAQAAGVKTADGLQMFVGQALDQFRYFTGQEPPAELMTQVVVDDLNKKK